MKNSYQNNKIKNKRASNLKLLSIGSVLILLVLGQLEPVAQIQHILAQSYHWLMINFQVMR